MVQLIDPTKINLHLTAKLFFDKPLESKLGRRSHLIGACRRSSLMSAGTLKASVNLKPVRWRLAALLEVDA